MMQAYATPHRAQMSEESDLPRIAGIGTIMLYDTCGPTPDPLTSSESRAALAAVIPKPAGKCAGNRLVLARTIRYE